MTLSYVDQFGETFVTGTDREHFGGYPGPGDIAVMKDGSILVSDTINERVIRLSEDLEYLGQFGETAASGADREHLTYPEGLAVAKDGSVLVVDNDNLRLIRLSEDLKYIDQFGETGSGGTDDEHFGWPCRVAVMKDGCILVSDNDNNRVVRLSEDLRYIDQFGETGVPGVAGDREHIRSPYGIAVAKDGSILVVDENRDYLIKLSEDLEYIGQFAVAAAGGTDREHMNSPLGLAVMKDGCILVADGDNDRVIRLSEDLEYLDQFGETNVTVPKDREHLYFPYDVEVAKDGSILVADSHSYRLIRLTEG